MYIQKIFLGGRMGRDVAEIESQSGRKFYTFSLAVTSKRNNTEKTYWYEIFAPAEKYANMVKYLKKGVALHITGDLDCDSELGKDGVTRCRRRVNAESISFINTGSHTEQSTKETTEASAPSSSKEASLASVEDEINMGASFKPKSTSSTTVSEEVASSDDDLPF